MPRVLTAAVVLLAGGTAAAPHFPLHSWATVPAFLHTSVLNDAIFCAADLAVAARFAAVTLEKWQGCNSTAGCYRPNNLAGAGAGAGACPSREAATLQAGLASGAAPTVHHSVGVSASAASAATTAATFVAAAAVTSACLFAAA